MDMSEKNYAEKDACLRCFERRWSLDGVKTLIKISVRDF